MILEGALYSTLSAPNRAIWRDYDLQFESRTSADFPSDSEGVGACDSAY